MEEKLMDWEEFVEMAIAENWQLIVPDMVARKMRDRYDEFEVTICKDLEICFQRYCFEEDNLQFYCKSFESAFFAANSMANSCDGWMDEEV